MEELINVSDIAEPPVGIGALEQSDASLFDRLQKKFLEEHGDAKAVVFTGGNLTRNWKVMFDRFIVVDNPEIFPFEKELWQRYVRSMLIIKRSPYVNARNRRKKLRRK